VALVMLAVSTLTEASARNSWSAEGLVPLIYHGRPLPEVIEDVQRYTRRRIMIRADMRTFQYSGIVKPEDVDAWIQDLPAIYPVEVIDCRTYGKRGEMSACADPELIVIRSRLELHRNDLRSALR
jgi:ferric-dicitrate binding protein FerR (iron transport regulator)